METLTLPNSNDKYRRVVWQCNSKYKKGKEFCRTPHLNEDDIKHRFIDAFNQINIDRKQVVEDLELVLPELTDTTGLDSMLKALIKEMDRNVADQRKLIEDNSSIEMDQKTYEQNISKLQDEYSDIKCRVEDLQKQKLERIEKGKEIRNFIQELEQRPNLLTEFDDYLCYCTVDHVTVKRDKKLVFHFKNGMDIEVKFRG